MNKIIEKMDKTYFNNIEIMEGDFNFYHSCSIFTAEKILSNGFKGHLDNLHGTIINNELFNTPDSVVFATEAPQKDYGNTIIEIHTNKAIKAYHTEYGDWEILIPLSEIINISEYCE